MGWKRGRIDRAMKKTGADAVVSEDSEVFFGLIFPFFYTKGEAFEGL